MNFFFILLISISIVFVVVTLFSWYLLRKAIGAPDDGNTKTPADYHLKYQTKTFTTEDGFTIEGWYIPVKNAKAVIVVPHSYIYTKSTLLSHATFLHDGGYSTFFTDLRYDKNDTKCSMGIHEWKDAVAAYDLMKSLPENAKKKIGFYTGSMGGVISIIAAGKTGKGDFLVISVPFANFKSLFKKKLKKLKLPVFLLPFVEIAAFLEFGNDYKTFTAENYIQKIKKPIFLMSAKQDQTVDTQDTLDLFALANQPKELWEADAKHDIMLDEPEELKSRTLAFLKKYV